MKEKRIQIEGQDTSYLIRDDGTVWSEKRNRVLQGTVERNEYRTVYLTFNGKQYNYLVHRLVAQAFCENPNDYNVVHHIDGNKLNNCASNLQWVTTSENILAVQEKKSPDARVRADVLKHWVALPFNGDYAVNMDGEIMNLKTGYLLKGSIRNGYIRIRIENQYYSLHRLIFETFHGYCPKIVDHIDGNRSNNRLDNLREVTQQENMKYAMKNGHKGQVPVLQFDKQHNFIQEFPTIQAAANAMGVCHNAIQSAINRHGTSAGYYWERK